MLLHSRISGNFAHWARRWRRCSVAGPLESGTGLPQFRSRVVLLFAAPAHYLRSRLYVAFQAVLSKHRHHRRFCCGGNPRVYFHRRLSRIGNRKAWVDRHRHRRSDGSTIVRCSHLSGGPRGHAFHHGESRAELRPTAVQPRVRGVGAERCRGDCALPSLLQLLREGRGHDFVSDPGRGRGVRDGVHRQHRDRGLHRPALLLHVQAQRHRVLPHLRDRPLVFIRLRVLCHG
mmetsp:Transcript_39375/g.72481  ORF Transcript_39375/g.72481 Transcript_39375/m.72481 type:complete len:231 (-) Transcript_39375:149-841(-)